MLPGRGLVLQLACGLPDRPSFGPRCTYFSSVGSSLCPANSNHSCLFPGCECPQPKPLAPWLGLRRALVGKAWQ